MPFPTYFYNQSIKNYVSAFGSLFNDIKVHKVDSNGIVTKVIDVPLAYAAYQKYFAHKDGVRGSDNDGSKPKVKMTVPRISYVISALQSDPSRRLQVDNERHGIINGVESVIGEGKPWDIGFTVKIIVKDINDGLQIIEQILPAFSSSYSMTLKEVPDMNIEKDVHIILNSVDMNDDYEGSFEKEQRFIIWELQFTLKGRLYPPIRTSTGKITNITLGMEDLPLNQKLEELGIDDVSTTLTGV